MSNGLQDDNNNKKIQGFPLEKANSTSPYTVLITDTLVEFTDGGDVTLTMEDDSTRVKTVLAGARYALGSKLKTIAFDDSFCVH